MTLVPSSSFGQQASYLARLDTTEAIARQLAETALEILDPDEVASSAFEAEDEKSWIAEIYFAHQPDESAMRTMIASWIGASEAKKISFSALEQKDWVANSLSGLNPVRAGRFLIHGSHDRAAVKVNDWGLEIEAALAFGTGHHGTTLGCLLHFEALRKQRLPMWVLDVGTGTGVLAFAAAKATKRRVYAGDIDPISVAVTHENAKLNQLGAYLRPVVSVGVRAPELNRTRFYDVVFANILKRPLQKLAPSLARVTAHGGTLILSGLLAPDVNGVLSSFRDQGFTLVRRYDHQGWASLSLKRGGKR